MIAFGFITYPTYTIWRHVYMYVFSAEWAPDGPTIRTGRNSKILGKEREKKQCDKKVIPAMGGRTGEKICQ